MTTLPEQGLTGISFGILLGIVSGIVVILLWFLLTKLLGRSVPKSPALLIGVPIAGGLAFSVGLFERTGYWEIRLFTGTVVVVLLTLYAASQGSRLATELPSGTFVAKRHARTLSGAAIDDIDGDGSITIEPSGSVDSIEGYPELPPERRQAIEQRFWDLPGDLPLSELERRLERRLISEFELATASVAIDPRGRASLKAAPSTDGIAPNVPDGWRAVSVDTRLPTGLTIGDEISVHASDRVIDGVVLDAELDATPRTAPTRKLDGGPGRLTVAVQTADAGAVLDADRIQISVPPQQVRHEYEAFSLLDRAGWTIKRVQPDVLDEGAQQHVLASRVENGWQFDVGAGSDRDMESDQESTDTESDEPRQQHRVREAFVAIPDDIAGRFDEPTMEVGE